MICRVKTCLNILFGAALAAAACSGQIAESHDPPRDDPGIVPPAQDDPGRATLARLNNTQYNNTVRDLLGTALRPADDFPADVPANGFDNNADALVLSPLQFEMYDHAAEVLAAEAMAPANRARLFACDPAAGGDACLQSTLRAFARRAWRRPVTDAETGDLWRFVELARAENDPWERGMSLAIEAALTSPHFLFRVELDADPRSGTPRALSAHELATRLSYFLWSTMPDDALFAAADAGQLGDDAALRAQLDRMMADPRATALTDNFAAQWLKTRKLDVQDPDRGLFPAFDEALRDGFRQETALTMADFLAGRRPMTELLVSDRTYLNDRLARHYGLPAVGSSDLRLTSVAGSPRGGLLAQGAILTVTSYNARTAPTMRGKWVLEELLCSPPPAPPPGVEGLPAGSGEPQTLRERLEEHRTNPACAACHAAMDTIGLGLENFDAVGAWRTTDNGVPIDGAGELPEGGGRFSDARELGALIAADPRLPECVTGKLYGYALGRLTSSEADQARIARLARGFVDGGWNLRDLLTRIVLGDAFRLRRGDPADAPTPGVAP